MGELMCTVPAYHRSFREMIPLNVSLGNAPALLLIVSAKLILRAKKPQSQKNCQQNNASLTHFCSE